MFEIFNTREVAIGIWALIAITIFSLTSVRKSFSGILIAFFNRKILRTVALVICYMAFCVWLLYFLELWTVALLKDTVLWTIFVGVATLFKMNTIIKDKGYFKNAVKDNLKFMAILEFVIGLYNFSFWTEFMIVPTGTFVAVMVGFTQKSIKYEKVYKLFNGVLIVTGFVLIFRACILIIMHFKEFATTDHLREFLLGPTLSFLFMPFIYFMSIYMQYEDVLVRAKFVLQSPELFTYAKRKAFFKFRFDIDGLKRWVDGLNRGKIKDSNDIDQSIEFVKHRQSIERKPPVIDKSKGWSPYAAIKFLGEKVDVGYYGPKYEDGWGAQSSYIRIGDGLSSNKITYYVGGTELIADKLELVLSVFTPDESYDYKADFLGWSAILYERAVMQDIPTKTFDAIIQGRNSEIVRGRIKISTRKSEWGNSTNSYDLFFTIQHKGEEIA